MYEVMYMDKRLKEPVQHSIIILIKVTNTSLKSYGNPPHKNIFGVFLVQVTLNTSKNNFYEFFMILMIFYDLLKIVAK